MNDDRDSRLGKLVRGERAAVDAYEDALEDVGRDAPAARILDAVLDDHRRALAALEGEAGAQDVDTDDGAGPWGAFTGIVEKAAGWMGDAMALKALKEGEVHGVAEYRTALAQDGVPQRLRGLIESELLPRQLEHVDTLDELVECIEDPERMRTLEDRVREKAGR